MDGECSTYGEEYKSKLVWGWGTWIYRYRLKWEDNIKASLKELVWESVVRINLARDKDKWQILRVG
jgi:hypothetical protein